MLPWGTWSLVFGEFAFLPFSTLKKKSMGAHT